MRILGIDPGATTGWCVYDSDSRTVVECGTFEGADFLKIPGRHYDKVHAVLERPVAQGATRPQVVECAWIAGMLFRDCQSLVGSPKSYTITRLQVRQLLTQATYGTIRVVNDATAWAALVQMHGEGSDKKPRRKKGVVVEKGGPLGEVSSHARAALAAAVAWLLLHSSRNVLVSMVEVKP